MKHIQWIPLVLLLALAQERLPAAETINAAAGMAFTSSQDAGSARSIALGSSAVGIAEGSDALAWNPAGLAGLCTAEAALNHNSTLVGSFRDNLVLGLPLDRAGGLGLSVNYADNGVFEGRDEAGHLTSDYSARAFGASAGWGFQAPEDLSFGLAVKVNREDLADDSFYDLAGDLGVLWSPTPSLRLGAAYNNLGLDVAGAHLEQGVSLGISSYFWKGSDVEWLAALSGESLTHGDSSVHVGLETTLFHMLSLRGGYSADVDNPQAADGLLGWTLGGGVHLAGFSVDYAFVPMEELGNVQRLSLTYAFGACPTAPGKRS